MERNPTTAKKHGLLHLLAIQEAEGWTEIPTTAKRMVFFTH